MKHLPEYNLFNAIDNILMPYLTQEDFDRSLLFNILFQDKLLVHESSFFTSYYLAYHIKNSRHSLSLFEAAAKEGLIVPAFRNVRVNSLMESYYQMRPIYGMDYQLINEEYDPGSFARMHLSIDLGRQKQDAFFWPQDVILGEGYHEVLNRFLQQEELPDSIKANEKRHDTLMKYWSYTKEWRFDLINLAAKNTVTKGSQGIQRTEIMKLIAAANGLPPSVGLDGKKPLTSYVDDPNTKKAIGIFLKWISQCHHINMARTFGSSQNFPAYKLNEDFIFDSMTTAPRTDSTYTKQDSFTCTVQLPPAKLLLSDHPNNLISIRNDIGYAYLSALKEWQEEPGDYTMTQVSTLFKIYCQQICKWYSNYKPVEVRTKYASGTGVAKDGFDLVNNVISAFFPIAGIFMALSKFGYAFYEYQSDQHKRKLQERTMEINLPATPFSK